MRVVNRDQGKLDLFVVSNSRQALNVKTFIKLYGADLELNPLVFGLYTSANRDERAEIQRILEGNDINHRLVKFPRGAPHFSVRKYRIMHSKYKKIAGLDIKRAYLFNRNTHYNILYDMLLKAGVSINFVEEGLSSYKISSEYAPRREIYRVLKNEIVDDSIIGKVLLGVFASSIFIVSHPKRSFKKCCAILLREYRFLVRALYIFLDNPFFHKLISTAFKFPIHKQFMGQMKGFDVAYGVFPNELKALTGARESRYFNYIASSIEDVPDGTRSDVSRLGVTARSIIYLDQSYDIDFSLISKEIGALLTEKQIDCDYIIIKAHPKSADKFNSFEMPMKIGDAQVKIWSIDGVPGEYIPALTPCRTFIGLTSTTLVYAQTLYSDVKCYSIYKRVVSGLNDRSKVKMIIKQHGDIIEGFSGVEFV